MMRREIQRPLLFVVLIALLIYRVPVASAAGGPAQDILGKNTADFPRDPSPCAYVAFKDNCYFELAKTMHDPAICKKLSVRGGSRESCYSLVAPDWKRRMDNLSMGVTLALFLAFAMIVRRTIRSPRFAVMNGILWGIMSGIFPTLPLYLGFGGILTLFALPVVWVDFFVSMRSPSSFTQEEPMLQAEFQLVIASFVAQIGFYGLFFFLLGQRRFKTLVAVSIASVLLSGLALLFSLASYG